ncbi:uncharacterized protein LOC108626742 [Ceratina calcarata]|uniref:Uncharacterized protein LOC108626742 n=1 Tax=Ceratina calcarata TaxID=156304 RepID=A0AAJ7N8J8_9HYME|nr:uncharacterized protein LOC108626742 [Ceratina calcarata]
MSRTVLLSGFVTPTINGESRRSPLNESAPYVSGDKRTCTTNILKDTLVDHYGGANKTKREGYKIINMVMESGENTHLLCGKSMYEAIQLEGTKGTQKNQESLNDNFTYYVIDPMCMNFRLCIFWLLWVTLIVVLAVYILYHCCFPEKLNHYLGQMVLANKTHV